MNLIENAQRIREEVVEHLLAPAGSPGKKDLVLMPSHLFLTIHESIGHPTELDRALGYEANYAGTSYLTVDKLRQRADRERHRERLRRPHHRARLGNSAYDDDGVKTTKFPIISKGIFSGYQTIRDQAHLIGEKRNRAAVLRRFLGERAVPANAQCFAGAGWLRRDDRRSDRRR